MKNNLALLISTSNIIIIGSSNLLKSENNLKTTYIRRTLYFIEAYMLFLTIILYNHNIFVNTFFTTLYNHNVIVNKFLNILYNHDFITNK